MIALFAAKITLELFTPLLIGSALALAVFGLGRFLATRKFTRALDDDDGLLDSPAAETPRAIHHNAAFVANREEVAPEPAAPLLRDLHGSGIKCKDAADEEAPVSIEFVRTRKFTRSRSRRGATVRETDERTIECNRVYLGSDDLIIRQ